MAIRNWRWWQWLAVGVVVGGLLGLVLTNFEWTDPTMASDQFNTMRRKIAHRTDAGESVLTRIRVGPVVRDGEGKLVQQTTFWERQKNRTTGTWDLTGQFRVITPVPLSPASPRPDYGILDYLATQKQAIPSLDYRYQWWLVPRTLWLLSLGGSVLAIGVVWPVVNRLLVRLGLGAPPDERAAGLSEVMTRDETVSMPSGVVVTADDQQRLADLNAAMEANVAGLAMTETAGPAADEPGTARPTVTGVRELHGERVAPVAAAAAVQDDPSDFKGEFYPVARPVGKKDA